MTTFGNSGAFKTLKKLAFNVSLRCFFVALSVMYNAAYAQQSSSDSPPSSDSSKPGIATLIIEVVSTTSANRGKNYKITHYADENCSKRGKRTKVFEKKYAKDTHVFNPLEVDTGSNLVFQVAYKEERREGTRACSNIANVALAAGRTYKAVYRVVEEVIGCEINIYDISDDAELAAGSAPSAELSEIEFIKPEYTCKKAGVLGFKNGTPVYSYKNRLG